MPHAYELREWLALFSESLGLPQAAAIVHYIRWRAKGSPLSELPPGVPSPHVSAPTTGPGTELKLILSDLGITSKDCPGYCQRWIDKMNIWGISGCREHFQEIREHLQKSYDEASIRTKLKALANATTKGLPMTLEGLVLLAIERADLANRRTGG